jgi:hypothetical protein
VWPPDPPCLAARPPLAAPLQGCFGCWHFLVLRLRPRQAPPALRRSTTSCSLLLQCPATAQAHSCFHTQENGEVGGNAISKTHKWISGPGSWCLQRHCNREGGERNNAAIGSGCLRQQVSGAQLNSSSSVSHTQCAAGEAITGCRGAGTRAAACAMAVSPPLLLMCSEAVKYGDVTCRDTHTHAFAAAAAALHADTAPHYHNHTRLR